MRIYVYYASVISYIGSNRHYETPALWRGVFYFRSGELEGYHLHIHYIYNTYKKHYERVKYSPQVPHYGTISMHNMHVYA